MSTDSTQSSDPTERRQKIVMALGIATIILFSANLLTVLAHHFWPESGIKVPFLSEQADVAEAVVVSEGDAIWEFNVHRAPHHKHRVIVRHPHRVQTFSFNGDAVEAEGFQIHMKEMLADELDRELAEMELHAQQLESEFESIQMQEIESVIQMEELQAQSSRIKELAEKMTRDLEAVEVEVLDASEGSSGTHIKIRKKAPDASTG